MTRYAMVGHVIVDEPSGGMFMFPGFFERNQVVHAGETRMQELGINETLTLVLNSAVDIPYLEQDHENDCM